MTRTATACRTGATRSDSPSRQPPRLNPYVDLQCFQNGVLVAEGWRGYFDGSLDTPNFGLYGGGWMSGAADCTAYLATSTRRGMQRLASTSFHVDA